MSVSMLSLTGRPVWKIIGSGSARVAIAQRDALGTTARVVAWPSPALRPVIGAVDRELERLDLAASRFRPDSELSRIHQRDVGPVRISAGLAEAVRVALAAAQWTDGLVDPTVGGALIRLGYDRDFAEVGTGQGAGLDIEPAGVPGWQRVSLSGTLLHVPPGVRLDLGATAKGLGADWAAAAANDLGEAGGVLVSLGGDMAAAGESPVDGWPVLVADDHRQTDRSSSPSSPTQLVRLAGGGLATSSILCRQWMRSGHVVHHIIDPRSGLPADGPWRTASVAAATCAIANAASTAAIISGLAAPGWLAANGLAARLVAHDGSVVMIGDWPAADNGPLRGRR
ncbi:MAG: FAD:protein FMN transferase [Streptosporangiaceae bacterium]